MLVGPGSIADAARRIGPWVLRTPLVGLDRSGVLLKAESLQSAGSFKLRGAFNTVLQLSDSQRRRGVVAHSSGNHAIAVAAACERLGVPATIVMPDDAPAVKLDRARSHGATVEVVGPSSSERARVAAELARERDLTPVEPYDAVEVIAATATIGAEIVEDLARADGGTLEVYVPVSGGGLIAGVAAALAHHAAASGVDVRVVGAEPVVAADALQSLRAGERVELPAEQMSRTAADGLRVAVLGELPWHHIRRHVEEVVTVTEDEITSTMGRLARDARLVAEPSGAVAPAAAIAAEALGDPAVTRVAVLSGGNVDPSVLGASLGTR